MFIFKPSPLLLLPLIGLLYHPWMIDGYACAVITNETQTLEENLPQYHSVHNRSHKT
jgi:hypothetical protein